MSVLTEDDGSDLGLFEIECQTGCAIAEIQHLIEHASSPSILANGQISRTTPTFSLATPCLAPPFGLRFLQLSCSWYLLVCLK